MTTSPCSSSTCNRPATSTKSFQLHTRRPIRCATHCGDKGCSPGHRKLERAAVGSSQVPLDGGHRNRQTQVGAAARSPGLVDYGASRSRAAPAARILSAAAGGTTASGPGVSARRLISRACGAANRPQARSPRVVAGSVSAPGSSGFGDQAGGCLVVVTEGLRDDGSRGLEDELSDCRGPAALRRDADLAQVHLKADRVHRLSGPASGEEPL